MSFMFNCYPHHDMTAINRPEISPQIIDSVVSGVAEVCNKIGLIPNAHFAQYPEATSCIIALDGYVGTRWESLVEKIITDLEKSEYDISAVNMSQYYHPSHVLEDMFHENLPTDSEIDPVLLFGKLYKGTMSDLFDPGLLAHLKDTLVSVKRADAGAHDRKRVMIVHGSGAATLDLVDLYDSIVYYDMTPMNVVLRALKGEVKTFGDNKQRVGRDLFRRLYYIDYEVAIKLRQKLLDEHKIQYYVHHDINGELTLIPGAALTAIYATLVKYPLRCKPCYIEGVWGGFFIKELRKLPEGMKNCAWVFDLIPNEVSLAVEVGDHTLEFPFASFFRKESVALMGRQSVEQFGNIFPIRFNYDDTYHGPGNMSIQVHPPRDYCKNNFGESFQQDESYYVVKTDGSCTYLGLKEQADVDEFFRQIRHSEQNGTIVDYQAFINSVPSQIGTQVMIPGGTVHASGQNQVVLEIGSCTVGSYTFKLYDYLRKDLDGHMRPIHSRHGQNVLDINRRKSYVDKHLVLEPRLVRRGPGWSEHVVGEHEKIFFSLRRLRFDQQMEDDTNGKFHVLTLVEGERVLIQSVEHPERAFEQHYLNVVLVPACMGPYVLKNLGPSPIHMHKTLLKVRFRTSSCGSLAREVTTGPF